MRTVSAFTRLLISLALSALGIAHAQAPPAAAPAAAVPDPAKLCPQPAPPLQSVAVFPDIRDGAKEVRRVFCVKAGSQAEILDALTKLITQQLDKDWFKDFGGFQNNADPFRVARDLVIQGSGPPTMSVSPFAAELFVNGSPMRVADETKCAAEGKKRNPAIASCDAVLEEFAKFYNEAQTTYASPGALAFAQATNQLSKDWDTYLNKTRAQTPLELLVNSAIFKKKEKETTAFLPPPDVQWVLLHPSLVVENVKDAFDGEKTKTALMVELAGANWWRREEWYIPSGASVISVYTDRAGASDVGYGLAIYFRSVYSIGYTRHGGKDGLFVSFDLLKLAQDKKTVMESYRP